MPLTNPWLGGDVPTGKLERDVLEDRILNLLSATNMGVVATTGDDGPLATPVRYFSLGFAVMFTASLRSPKMRNIAADPRVSIGIHAPLVGLASSRGAQLFGTAEVVTDDDPRFAHFWEAFRWESEQIEQGRSPDDSPGSVVVVEAERIVYTEHWLRKSGYAPRQFWRRA
ncbi:MAG: pyridoxamine 5'-phosphate oxidase family protein [Actinomycetota bacterium]